MTGKDFAKIRKRLKLTQKQMPKLIGYAYRTVQDWEASDKVPEYASIIINLLEKQSLEKSTNNDSLLISQINELKDDKISLKGKIELLKEKINILEDRLSQYEPKSKDQAI